MRTRNQSAADSLAEGLDETLTLHRLEVHGVLGLSLKTTNCLESVNALVEERCATVDYWQNSRQPGGLPVLRVAPVDLIEAVSQADGIGLIDVDAFTTLVVRTDNSVYRITILTPHLREVVVQGGKFFPERTRACLSRSTLTGIVGLR